MERSNERKGDARLRGGERAGQGRVRVAVDHDQLWLEARQREVERLKHAAGLRGGRGRAHAQLAVGRRDCQLLEEDARHVVVVVLARVDDCLVVPLPEQPRHRRRLHELGPVAYYRDDPHVCPGVGVGTIPAARLD